MRKKFITLLSILILSSAISTAYSKSAMSSDLSSAINMYKRGDYAQCYVKLEEVVKKDPANALAYYYLAMSSAQLGKKAFAIENYEKTMSLTSENTTIYRYANKGKVCLENPEQCSSALYTNKDDEFIYNKSKRVTDEVKSDMDKLKIENMMREINRSDEIDPQKFKEYKDFSSYNPEGTPSNDEIVAAIKTLQRAGLGNLFNPTASDLSMLTGSNSMMNMMGNSGLSPQVIQAMFTNNMSLGF